MYLCPPCAHLCVALFPHLPRLLPRDTLHPSPGAEALPVPRQPSHDIRDREATRLMYTPSSWACPLGRLPRHPMVLSF